MNKIERKTVFLYPELKELNRKDIQLTNNLISSMNLIVDSCNEMIRAILTSGNFSFIEYLPSMLLRCVSDDYSSPVDSKNVRICIIGFNNIDYSSNYNQVIHEFKHGTSDISHLVAIHILDSAQKPRFLIDDNGNFDILIHTSMDDIEKILVSIMLDISLYHYFSLSGELKERVKFNSVKYSYIHSSFSVNDQETIYGCVLDERTRYLPLSLKNINKLSRRKSSDRRSETIDELIKDFEHFLLLACSHKIRYNDRGSILNPNEHRENIYNFDVIQEYIKEHVSLITYYIIVPEKLTDKASIYMVENKCETDSIKEWVELASKYNCNYQIIEAIKEA